MNRLTTTLIAAMLQLLLAATAWAQASDFGLPQAVSILSLPTARSGQPLGVEEPFVSRDGRWLFFNSSDRENAKDLYFAEWAKGTWLYRGELGPGVNTPKEVQGAPSMDNAGNFYFTDSSAHNTARLAKFSAESGTITQPVDIPALPQRDINMQANNVTVTTDVEVTADGAALYFSQTRWEIKDGDIGEIEAADLHYAWKKGSQFEFSAKESERILRNINTPDLEYAASISVDNRQLFFTQMKLEDLKAGRIRSRILVATRNSENEPFSLPSQITSIGANSFVEGPSISSDGKTLYFHRRDAAGSRLYRVQRP